MRLNFLSVMCTTAGPTWASPAKTPCWNTAARACNQPLDLQIAKCRISVAVRSDFDYQSAVKKGSRLTVATKYVEISREFFASKGVHVDLTKLYGSMELAPPGRHGRCHR